MNVSTSDWRQLRPTGMRAGIVIGLAVAMVGALVGTAAAVDTMFQKVVVVNAATQPVPVSGTVNVGNAPSNQNVTVSNFPATQPVSGTVTVANSVATKGFETTASFDASDTHVFAPVGSSTINASYIYITSYSTTSDKIQVSLDLTQGGGPLVYVGDTDFRQAFTTPVGIRDVEVVCLNAFFSCDLRVSVIGS